MNPGMRPGPPRMGAPGAFRPLGPGAGPMIRPNFMGGAPPPFRPPMGGI